jgi:uncharacterized membrane protein YedE/YeeE
MAPAWLSNQYTPVSATVGGAILGLSSTVLLWQTGRWSGVSSIYRNATEKALGSWQQTWVAGCLGAMALARVTQSPLISAYVNSTAVDAPLLEVVLASVLIGAGSKIGNGCTSGHGIMGVSRGSLRSIVATCTFLITGALTATFLRPLLLAAEASAPAVLRASASSLVPKEVGTAGTVAIAAACAYALALDLWRDVRAATTTFVCGLTFGIGLLVSGMVDASKIINFLDMRPLFSASPGADHQHQQEHLWDPSMIIVMCSALTTTALTFNLWLLPNGTQHHDGQEAAIPGLKYCLPTATKLTSALVFGSAVFGVGWGLSGICVGPAVVNAASGGVGALAAIASVSLGSYLSRLLDPLFS